jgi:hypothetical protein
MSPVLEQVEAFRIFVLGRLSDSKSEPTIEELFEEWRLLNLSPEECEANMNAIGEALREFDNGAPSQPWEEFDQEFRARHGI